MPESDTPESDMPESDMLGSANAGREDDHRRELAQAQVMRLRVIYALFAGALLLVGLPLYQSVVLGPTGYAAAVQSTLTRGDFAPLVAWIAGNPGADRLNRIVELLPFLLALPLPGFVYRRLWPALAPGGVAPGGVAPGGVAPGGVAPASRTREDTVGVVALWAGRVGFALFALAIVVGFFASAASAGAYASASSAAGRRAAVASYATSYTVQSLLAQVVGGLALALFLVLLIRRASDLPTYFRLYSYLVAAVLTLNALAFLLDLSQVQTPFTSGALLGLGLWLIGLGLFLPGLAAPTTADRTGRAAAGREEEPGSAGDAAPR